MQSKQEPQHVYLVGGKAIIGIPRRNQHLKISRDDWMGETKPSN